MVSASTELCVILNLLGGYFNSKIVCHVASVNTGFCVLSLKCLRIGGVEFKLTSLGARLRMCSLQAWNCVLLGEYVNKKLAVCLTLGVWMIPVAYAKCGTGCFL